MTKKASYAPSSAILLLLTVFLWAGVGCTRDSVNDAREGHAVSLAMSLKNVLPGQEKEKPQQAEVIAVGPGGVVDGKEIKMEVKAGDKVIYSKYAGTEVKLEDEKFIIVKQNDILAVIE